MANSREFLAALALLCSVKVDSIKQQIEQSTEQHFFLKYLQSRLSNQSRKQHQQLSSQQRNLHAALHKQAHALLAWETQRVKYGAYGKHGQDFAHRLELSHNWGLFCSLQLHPPLAD
jgi:hypothetical protein